MKITNLVIFSSKNVLDIFNNILIDINMDIFNNAVTSFIPETLIGVLTKFGNDQKDRVFKIMENK